MNRIVAALSRLLERSDRECISGDVEELRLIAPAAATNILSLVVRRQLSEWSHWGAWAALLAVAGFTGYALSGALAQVEAGTFLQVRTYLRYGVAYEPGGVSAIQEITCTATAFLALLLWSWACGFVLASIARRTFWITAFLFYCNVRDTYVIRLAMDGNLLLKHGLWPAMLFRLLPSGPIIITFSLALALGLRAARKGTLQRNTSLCLTAAGLALVLLLVWMESWFAMGFAHWSGQPYLSKPFLYRMLPWLAGAWPVFLIPLLRGRRHEIPLRSA